MGVDELLTANLHRVFGERDPAARRAAMGELLSEQIRFADAEGVVVGHDAVDAKVQAILDGAPGFVFAADGPARVAQELGVLAWTFGPEGGAPVVSGIDVATVADGRIATLHTVLTS